MAANPIETPEGRIYAPNSKLTTPLTFDEALLHLRQNCKVVDYKYMATKLVAFRNIRVFKAAKNGAGKGVIVNLTIPKGSTIVINDMGKNIYSPYKCRAERAVVHSIFEGRWPHKKLAYAASDWDSSFLYRQGQTVLPQRKFETSMACCASGIHFFVDVSTALIYGGMAYPAESIDGYRMRG